MDQALGNLSALPIDALTHVVSFLSSKDALQLAELNSSFQSTLALSTLHDPTPLAIRYPLYGTHNEESNTPHRAVWIPVMFPHRTHSIVLTCTWRDQGYGNQKGCLFVVAVPSENDPDEATLESIENGKIVYQSPLAPHLEESLTFSFSYTPAMSYYVWYRIGGGGGHQLRVQNFRMHTIIHDYSGGDKWIGRNYNALSNQGFLENHDDFSLEMLEFIAAAGQEQMNPEIAAHLAVFLGSTGFSNVVPSMKSLGEIAAALKQIKAKKAAQTLLNQSTTTRANRRIGGVALVRHQPRDVNQLMMGNGNANVVHVFGPNEAPNLDQILGNVEQALGGIMEPNNMQEMQEMLDNAFAQVNDVEQMNVDVANRLNGLAENDDDGVNDIHDIARQMGLDIPFQFNGPPGNDDDDEVSDNE